MNKISKNIIRNIRVNILKKTYQANSSHIGSCYSIVEILYALYFLKLKKKDQKKNIKKFNTIKVVEDHLKDGGFQSWLNECDNETKLISKSLKKEVINKVGSKEFLMNYLK